MSKVVAIKKDDQGRIVSYKTDDGNVYDHNQCVQAIESGSIEGLMTFTNREGDLSIRSKRGQEDYKLSELPEF